jgi:GntR family transcriptional regulator
MALLTSIDLKVYKNNMTYENALVDPDAARSPRYRSIAVTLRKEVLAGRWPPGERVPTEGELAERFGVSQGTARLAILELVKTGLLSRYQGRGTFVSALRLDNSLERFFRYGRRDIGEHIRPETRLLESRVVVADQATRAALGLESRAKVGWLRRLRLYDGERFLFHDSYFSVDLWQRIKASCDFEQPDLYRQLQERCGTAVVKADEYLTPTIATTEEAQILAIVKGSAVAHLERHSYTFGQKKIEFRRSTGRGDRFSYHVQL